jgi:hypothetical protein
MLNGPKKGEAYIRIPLTEINGNGPGQDACQDQVGQKFIEKGRQNCENGVLGLVVLVPAAGNVFYDFSKHSKKNIMYVI